MFIKHSSKQREISKISPTRKVLAGVVPAPALNSIIEMCFRVVASEIYFNGFYDSDRLVVNTKLLLVFPVD